MTRRDLESSTALLTSGWYLLKGGTAGVPLEPAEADAPPLAFSQTCLCSDGEIFLQGEDLLRRLLTPAAD